MKRWVLVGIAVVAIATAGVLGYHWVKIARAERFAAAADSFVKARKWNDAAMQYRVALQLDPNNYHALSGAARLASGGDRPESLEVDHAGTRRARTEGDART